MLGIATQMLRRPRRGFAALLGCLLAFVLFAGLAIPGASDTRLGLPLGQGEIAFDSGGVEGDGEGAGDGSPAFVNSAARAFIDDRASAKIHGPQAAVTIAAIFESAAPATGPPAA